MVSLIYVLSIHGLVEKNSQEFNEKNIATKVAEMSSKIESEIYPKYLQNNIYESIILDVRYFADYKEGHNIFSTGFHEFPIFEGDEYLPEYNSEHIISDLSDEIIAMSILHKESYSVRFDIVIALSLK
jgi:hypothetical protein